MRFKRRKKSKREEIEEGKSRERKGLKKMDSSVT